MVRIDHQQRPRNSPRATHHAHDFQLRFVAQGVRTLECACCSGAEERRTRDETGERRAAVAGTERCATVNASRAGLVDAGGFGKGGLCRHCLPPRTLMEMEGREKVREKDGAEAP